MGPEEEIDYQEILDQLVEYVQDHDSEFSAWEIDFVESLDGYRWENLTAAQQLKVEEIWEKV